MTIPFYDAETVERVLDYAAGIGVVREAMIALSAQAGAQPLRQVVPLEGGNVFGIMAGALGPGYGFGGKFVSVFGDAAHPGRYRHRGVIALFDGGTGGLRCLVDAEAVTMIRTACASAAATDALARHDARVLTILGTGTQALAHACALPLVRRFSEIRVWGRSLDRAELLVAKLRQRSAVAVRAMDDAPCAVAGADVICTTTSSATPVLRGAWVGAGTHVNLVGSSLRGPVEADAELVAKGRYIADYRPSALAQASELEVARVAGIVSHDHIAGEIGDVFSGLVAGRQTPDQITLYKSLGHIAQDIAAARYIHEASSR